MIFLSEKEYNWIARDETHPLYGYVKHDVWEGVHCYHLSFPEDENSAGDNIRLNTNKRAKEKIAKNE